MKTIFNTMIFFLTLVSTVCLNAQQKQQVTRDEAINVALTLLTGSNVPTGNSLRNINAIEKNDSSGNIVLFEISTDGTSLLLSGSKACYPVLAKYQTHSGSLLNCYNDLSENLRNFLDGYIQQISFCFNNDTTVLYYQAVWDSLIEGINIMQRDNVSVGPLVSTKWGQMGCNTGTSVGYEYSMPDTCNCNHNCLAGCVAVAMGQVMNYWKHPSPTNWNYFFDWCNMSDLLEDISPSFFQNRDAISNLLRDCGEKVHMHYGCNGSGAYFDSIRSALVDNYDYSRNASYIEKNRMSDDDWINCLKQEIDAGRPILYNATGSSGHAFICDGYGNGNFFNFNWGSWGQGNGSYLVGNLTPYFNGQQHSFLSGHKALIGIKPQNPIILCDRNVELDDYYRQYEDEISNGTYNPWEITPATVTNLTSASINSSALWRTIPTGATSTYKAQESITLKDGFSAKSGARFVAKIEPCINCGNSRSSMSQREVSQMDVSIGQLGWNDPTGEPSDEFQSKSLMSSADNDSEHNINVYPNPTEGQVAVEIPRMTEGKVSIQIMDIFGRQVMECHEDAATGSYRKTIDASSLPSGCYYVVVYTNENREVKCIIKQ